MEKFKKGDPEYIANGHYNIDGIHFMSIWTFKNKHGLEPNSNKVNGIQGIELTAKGVGTFDSIPDFGNFDSVLLYPVSSLEDYYDV